MKKGVWAECEFSNFVIIYMVYVEMILWSAVQWKCVGPDEFLYCTFHDLSAKTEYKYKYNMFLRFVFLFLKE